MTGYMELLCIWLWVPVNVHLIAAAPQIDCAAGQAIEGKPYKLFCTGISGADQVEWLRSFQFGGSDGVIASCNDVNICSVIDNTQYDASRPTWSTSTLTILRVQRDDDARWNWTCRSGGWPSSCNLLSTVYLPKVSTPCTAELTLGGPVVRCHIQKVYPAPECAWFESITPSNGAGRKSNIAIPPSSSEAQVVELSSFHDDLDDQIYYSATCELRRNVTYIEGNYSYTAIISPGPVRHVIQFVGPSSVGAPSQGGSAVGISLGVVSAVLLLLVVIIICIFWRRKQRQTDNADSWTFQKLKLQMTSRGGVKGQKSAGRRGQGAVEGLASQRLTGGQGGQSSTEPSDRIYEELYDSVDEAGKHVYRHLEGASKHDEGYIDMSPTVDTASDGDSQNDPTAEPQESSPPAAPRGQGGHRPGIAPPVPPVPPDSLSQTSSLAIGDMYLTPVHPSESDGQVYVGPDNTPGVSPIEASSRPLPPLPELPPLRDLPPLQTYTNTTTAASSGHPTTAASELQLNVDHPAVPY